MPVNPTERKLRELRKVVADAVEALRQATVGIDKTMKLPDSEMRGRNIAAIANHIDMTKDQLWHFGLDKPLPVKARRAR
jgi:hypothetical protein